MNTVASFRSRLTLSVAVFALAACAGKTPPPAITYDSGSFRQAMMEAAPIKPVEIVEIPTPLPLPGQLQPPPPSETKLDTQPPADRIETANKAATLEPTSHGYINAIQVYPYTEGALYKLYAAPEHVTDITLQPGEMLSAVSSGDTVRWTIGDTTSGSGDAKQVHVLVKPFAPALKTNLVITTDKRSYHLQLESSARTALAAISWTYPQDRLFALQRQNAAAEAAVPPATGIALENLKFRYAISGDSPAWRPLRAFDDGSKVYIEFPSRIDQGEVPPLFVVGPDGDNQLVNYRVRGNYYVVDRLFAAAELRLGMDPQQIVRIGRTDGVAMDTNARHQASR